MTSWPAKELRVPALLLLLSAVPMLGGALRLESLSEPATAESARFVASPVPVVLHIVSAALYSLLGAFQFSAFFRCRWPRWHRRAGKVVLIAGLLTGATGIWMTMLYAIPVALQGPLLRALRSVVGAGMVFALVVAWFSILRRNVARHEAWMIRAYALAQGAGTQVLVLGLPLLLVGEVVGLTRDVLMGFAWAINLGVAEWIIRRRSPAPRASELLLSAVTPRA